MGRISTGMTEKKRTLLDIDPADRARLLASATAYAAGRRTYVVGAVSDVIAANAGRLDAAARETRTDAIRPAADAGDPIDAPAWTRALAALETAAPDGSDGLDGSPVDLRILLFCAFRHDMGGDAGLWTRLLDDPPEEIDGQWRAISARDLSQMVVMAARGQNKDNRCIDDISCMVIYLRKPRRMRLLTGPPFRADSDAAYADQHTVYFKIFAGQKAE